MTRKLGEIKSGSETLVEMFAASNALSEDADGLSQGIYILSEVLIRGVLPDSRGGGLGGEFGYGCDFENDVFLMHHYCWCEKDDCAWCGGYAGPRFLSPNSQDTDCRAPHFWHKPSGLKVWWYKWIGRDMETNRPNITGAEWGTIWQGCFDSIPQEARDKAQAEHDHDKLPEVIAEREAAMSSMMEIMMNPTKYNAPIQKHTCDSCGKEYEYQAWYTVVHGSCDDCEKKMVANMSDKSA